MSRVTLKLKPKLRRYSNSPEDARAELAAYAREYPGYDQMVARIKTEAFATLAARASRGDHTEFSTGKVAHQ